MIHYRYSHARPLVRVRDLITIHYYELEPGNTFEGESHPFWELVYVDKGAIKARNGTHFFNAQAGDLICHEPDVFHWVQGDGTHYGYVFIISFTAASPFMEQFRGLHTPLPKELRSLISGIIKEATITYDMAEDGLTPLKTAPIGGEQMVRLYLEQLLLLLARREGAAAPVRARDLPGEMVLYLNNRVYGRLSISDLCRDLHYGKTQLSLLFRRATGQSILQYYRMLKINEAKRLLRDTDNTVAEISALLQFDTPQYFSRVFKNSTGLTPGEFRSMVRA